MANALSSADDFTREIFGLLDDMAEEFERAHDLIEGSECMNRLWLDALLVCCERKLQVVTEAALTAHTFTRAALDSIPAFHRAGGLTGPTDEWNISKCHAVLKRLVGIDQSKLCASRALSKARNFWSHQPGGSISRADFDRFERACVDAYVKLGGDAAQLQEDVRARVDKTVNGKRPRAETRDETTTGGATPSTKRQHTDSM